MVSEFSRQPPAVDLPQTGSCSVRDPFLLTGHPQQSGSILEFHLTSYEDLLELDFARLPTNALVRVNPLYLVCTHGRRDPCCARHGVALFNQLSALAPQETWQTSHVGGHRFAANMVVLPEGIDYGRVQLAELPKFIETIRAGEVYLPSLRGRASYPPEIQAAEGFLRQLTGRLGMQNYLSPSTPCWMLDTGKSDLHWTAESTHPWKLSWSIPSLCHWKAVIPINTPR